MTGHSFPFDMRKLLEHFRWPLPAENVRRGKYPCVFCNDRSKHMSVDFINDTYLCYRCGNHGGMLDLFRQVYGTSLDNRETTELIKEKLGLSSDLCKTDQRLQQFNQSAARDNLCKKKRRSANKLLIYWIRSRNQRENQF